MANARRTAREKVKSCRLAQCRMLVTRDSESSQNPEDGSDLKRRKERNRFYKTETGLDVN